MRRTVLVVGAGGLGGLVAGRMALGGASPWLLVRPGPIEEALRARGLRLRDPGLVEVPVRVVTSLDDVPAPDIVVLATQPNQVEAAAEQILPVLSVDSTVVVLQNGLCERRVAAIVGEDRVVGAVVGFGASVDGPGEVRRSSYGGITVGRLDGGTQHPSVRDARSVLELVAPVAVTHNLRGARWTKLAYNCAISTLGTIGGDCAGPLVQLGVTRRLALELLSEVVLVAEAEGVVMERLAGFVGPATLALTPREGRGTMRPSLWAKHASVLAVGLRIRNLRSSMLRALEAGDDPPVDFLNGEVVQAAMRHGLSVPVNEACVAEVKALGQRRYPPGVDRLAAVFDATG